MKHRPPRSGRGRDSFDDAFGGGHEGGFDGGRSRGGYDGGYGQPSGGYGQPSGGYGGYGDRPERPSYRAQPQADRHGMKATVKWFNAEKGFGFATLETGGDLFVHGSVVRAAGREELEPGARIVVDVAPSDRGDKAVAIHSVEDPDPASAPARGFTLRGPREGGHGGARPTPVSLGTVGGTVKWFDPVRGFGFVSPDGGGRDVFLHASALERSGIRSVSDGARVQMDVVEGRSGKSEVGSLRLA